LPVNVGLHSGYRQTTKARLSDAHAAAKTIKYQ
jgi:hypothetical protein